MIANQVIPSLCVAPPLPEGVIFTNKKAVIFTIYQHCYWTLRIEILNSQLLPVRQSSSDGGPTAFQNKSDQHFVHAQCVDKYHTEEEEAEDGEAGSGRVCLMVLVSCLLLRVTHHNLTGLATAAAAAAAAKQCAGLI